MVITTPFGGLGLDIDKFFSTTSTTPAYPPYNVIRISDDEYFMEFAVAGFKKSEISITTDNNALYIKGEKRDTVPDDHPGYIYKGIAARKFSRSFRLPEYFEVVSAKSEDGILKIHLERNIPEEKKPKTIKIN
jgi:molecular chaperone IbpA